MILQKTENTRTLSQTVLFNDNKILNLNLNLFSTTKIITFFLYKKTKIHQYIDFDPNYSVTTIVRHLLKFYEYIIVMLK
jgi:hypothetical protein